MKSGIIISLALLICLNINAQISIGIKGSHAISIGGESEIQELINYSEKAIYKIGAANASTTKGIGISFIAQNEKLFFLSDLMYVSQQSNYILSSTSFNPNVKLDPQAEFSRKTQGARVYVNAGVKLGNIKIGAGPNFDLNIEHQENLSDLEDIEHKNQKIKKGFNFLIGYEIMNHIHLDVRYNIQLQDESAGYKHLGTPVELKKQQRFIELAMAIMI